MHEIGSELAAALVAFQAECRDVAVNKEGKIRLKTGGEYSYKYADLNTVLAEVKPKLAKHGLAIIQSPISSDGGEAVGVSSVLVHSSGQTFDLGGIFLPMSQATPQGAGACITYARRYALGAIAGIATDHDDDAASQQASAPEKPRAEKPRKERAIPTAGTPAWFDDNMIGKKYKGKTWGYMTEGTPSGDRHSYLEYMEGWLAEKLQTEPQSKYARKNAEDLERVKTCIAIIENRAGLDDEEPPPPDDNWEGEQF